MYDVIILPWHVEFIHLVLGKRWQLANYKLCPMSCILYIYICLHWLTLYSLAFCFFHNVRWYKQVFFLALSHIVLHEMDQNSHLFELQWKRLHCLREHKVKICYFKHTITCVYRQKGVDKESRKKSYVSPDQKIKLFSEASELRGSTVCCVCIYVFVMNVWFCQERFLTYLEQKQTTFCSLGEKEGEKWMSKERVRGRTHGWIDR